MSRPPRHPPAATEPWLATGSAVAVHPYQALAHPIRRFLVDLVASREETAGDLAEMVQHCYGIGWPTVSHHLKVLHRAGLVRVRAVPPERLYRLDDDAIGRLESVTAALSARWESRAGGGYHCQYEPEEEPWPIHRARRRPADAEEAIDRILAESGIDAVKAPGSEPDTAGPKIRQNGTRLQQ